MEEKKDLKNLIPGLMQGLTRVSISYPFDVVKVNMQKLYFKNSYEAALSILKTDPFKFYRGSSLSYTTIGLERSIQYYYLEKLNKKGYNPYLTGFGMSIFSSLYNIPVQYITTNLAAKREKNLSLSKYIGELIKNRSNIYKGYMIETPKNILGSTLFLGTYYQVRNTFGENKYLSPFYGAISGLNVWFVIFPIDTVRTEYQTTKKNIKDIILERYKNNGIKSFYRGLTPIVIRTIPSASFGMFVYEFFREKLSLK